MEKRLKTSFPRAMQAIIRLFANSVDVYLEKITNDMIELEYSIQKIPSRTLR